MDSQESDPKENTKMIGGIEMHLPATLRKHVIRYLVPETDGQHDLITACKELQLGNTAHSVTVRVSNEALGAALDVCREWLDSDNGNKLMTAKTVLKRHELDYLPEDPRERRHEVKIPKSLGSYVSSQVTQGFLEDRPELLAELKACMNGDGSLSGRVTYGTLGWLLEVARSNAVHGAGAPQRAGKKFLDTYTEVYEKTGRLINGYLGTDDEGQAPAEVEAAEDQGQAVEVVEDDDQEPEEETAEQAEDSGPAVPVGPVPENFVWMAENADTETAKAWWRRKVESWGM
ncbi:hypothetical protein ACIRVF_11390 [Kitasatospora sp. NPDC101157]|uniref:hypothetical protein n=1 Tax=Kitasatospora sp. NPDC101157 TaxID=3364098 RepID=UPI00382D4247